MSEMQGAMSELRGDLDNQDISFHAIDHLRAPADVTSSAFARPPAFAAPPADLNGARLAKFLSVQASASATRTVRASTGSSR
jgi:hypothetical protein